MPRLTGRRAWRVSSNVPRTRFPSPAAGSAGHSLAAPDRAIPLARLWSESLIRTARAPSIESFGANRGRWRAFGFSALHRRGRMDARAGFGSAAKGTFLRTPCISTCRESPGVATLSVGDRAGVGNGHSHGVERLFRSEPALGRDRAVAPHLRGDHLRADQPLRGDAGRRRVMVVLGVMSQEEAI